MQKSSSLMPKGIALVKLLLLSLCLSATAVSFACSSLSLNQLSDLDKERISYFKDIALGFEFSDSETITRKWASDMTIYVSGKAKKEVRKELDSIITELNTLISDDLTVKLVKNQGKANFHIFFGSGSAYAKLYPEASNLFQDNWGLFFVYWDAKQYFYRGHMYVDTERASITEQRHLLREELTQSLGLAKDSFTYPDSIFQQDWTRTTRYAAIDRDIIRLLYHPSLDVGLMPANWTVF
ncbi:MAG: DUF2927 domain-containing protein [Trueperaceae bacterium]|nr:DUF2927 domain-containing protein [Trueperaceae bacterium]